MLAYQGERLLRRSRDLARNNPYAGSMAESFTANLVGTGIKPSSLTESAVNRQRINAAWLAWTDEADADGLTDFYGLQRAAAAAVFTAGEVFVRFRPRATADGLSVPLQLQLIEAEQCPLERSLPAGQNWIRNGIEFDPRGRRVAYHLYRTHPGDDLQPGANGLLVRVPADEVLHIFDPERPGQVRGVPRLARAMTRLFLLDQYDDAELARKIIAAAVAGFVTRQGEWTDPAESASTEDPGERKITWRSGTIHELDPGEDIKFAEPADVGGSYEAFMYRNILASCSAAGVPYANVTGDLFKASYSSLRAGLVEFRRRLNQFLWSVMVFQLCRPVWNRWIGEAVLGGGLTLPGYVTSPARYRRVKWIPDSWEWVDPLKDRQAEKLAVDAGFKARADVVEAEGEDVEAVDARIKSDRDREQALGLEFKPMKVSAAGETIRPEPARQGDGGAAPESDKEAA